jgi:hypothetical protein
MGAYIRIGPRFSTWTLFKPEKALVVTDKRIGWLTEDSTQQIDGKKIAKFTISPNVCRCFVSG